MQNYLTGITTGCKYAVREYFDVAFPVEVETLKEEMDACIRLWPKDTKLVKQVNVIRRRLGHASDNSIVRD